MAKAIGFVAMPILAVIWLSVWTSVSSKQIVAKRNFYGVLSVANGQDPKTGAVTRDLVHGRIVHGSQFQSPESMQRPTAYYTESSGVGIALRNHRPNRVRQIGVVGLGAGTRATYRKAGDRFRFYEINDDVIALAKEYFSFLEATPSSVETRFQCICLPARRWKRLNDI